MVWSLFIMTVNYVNVYLGGQMERGVLDRTNKLGAYLCSICPSAGVPNVHNLCGKFTTHCSEQRTHVQNAFFQLGTPPPSVCLGRD